MMKIWQISREYAGLAEAGGVKNVVASLCEQLVSPDREITLFIPLYGCTAISAVRNFEVVPDMASAMTVDGQNYIAFYGEASITAANGSSIKVIFVVSTLFTEKMGVYTYTPLEEKLNPEHRRGQGHADAPVLEMLFQKAVLWYGVLKNDVPDIIHCHDATTALIPVFARHSSDYRSAYRNTRFVVTVHNGGPFYHHEIDSLEKAVSLTGLSEEVLKAGCNNGKVEPYLLAAECSSLTTVSPWYAEELVDPDNESTDGLSKGFAERSVTVTGITNGLDYSRYNPTEPELSLLPFAYNPETLDLAGKKQCRSAFIQRYGRPASAVHTDPAEGELVQYGYADPEHADVWFSYHGRIAAQKGLDVLVTAIPLVLEKCPGARFLITGQGEPELENALKRIAEEQKGKCLYLRGYERATARLCVAAGDFIVLPSWFEPCGLEDFIASFLGTIPVVHATGGLQKTEHGKTGFCYAPNTPESLSALLTDLARQKTENPDCFNDIIRTAACTVHQNYSWEKVVENEYLPLYKKLAGKK